MELPVTKDTLAIAVSVIGSVFYLGRYLASMVKDLSHLTGRVDHIEHAWEKENLPARVLVLEKVRK